MLLKKIKINKRLIKKAEFLNGFCCDRTRDNFLSIYINPTRKEINEAKDESNYDCIRGLIMADGTTYCWNGEVLHDNLPSEADLPVNSKDAFRFAYEGDWIFDLHSSCTFIEGIRKFKTLIGELNKFGNVNTGMLSFFYGSDRGDNYSEYVEDEDSVSSVSVEFNCIEEMDELIKRIDNNNILNKEEN